MKISVAAMTAIAAIVGIAKFTHNPKNDPRTIGVSIIISKTITGPATHAFPDGSSVTLADGASIRVVPPEFQYRRGFEHVIGLIEVTVTKDHDEFVVTSPYGDVRVLNARFFMDIPGRMLVGVERPLRMLSVKVADGAVEVRNSWGGATLKSGQSAVMMRRRAPYGFKEDPNLPETLRQRIAAMVKAYETADKAAWASNFNMDYLYELGKGQAPCDPNLFGGSVEDAERIEQAVAGANNPGELRQYFLNAIDMNEPTKVYVRWVELSQNGRHAAAECVQRKSGNHLVVTRRRIWQDIAGRLHSSQDAGQSQAPCLWRVLMRTRFVKPVLAAVVLIAALAVGVETLRPNKTPKTNAFSAELRANTALDLDPKAAIPLRKTQPEDFDVTWDAEAGGTLRIMPGSALRLLPFSWKGAEWDEVTAWAIGNLKKIQESDATSVSARQNPYAAILTSEGNLAVIHIKSYDESRVSLLWQVESTTLYVYAPVRTVTLSCVDPNVAAIQP
jgi:ferric-dicitrate binding protein FerR (iron transport regulator)